MVIGAVRRLSSSLLLPPKNLSPLLSLKFTTFSKSMFPANSSEPSLPTTGDPPNTSMNTVDTILACLNSIAPFSFAEKWDNVGLIVEPSGPKYITSILLTNDLTASVLEEAKAKTVDVIISYHPPIFTPMKCLTQKTWKDKVAIECLENRIAVISPHTALDAAEDGLNDWLISAFDVDKESVAALEVKDSFFDNRSHVLEIDLDPENLSDVWKTITSFVPRDSRIKRDRSCYSTHVIQAGVLEKIRLRLECTQSELNNVMKGVSCCHTFDKYSVSNLTKVSDGRCGMGRRATLKASITIDQAVQLVKSHLKLQHVCLAKIPGADKPIKTVAVCAGSGSSVLKNVNADLLLTGEMSHHNVLDAVHTGSHVILCFHTNTERGFLPHLQQKLSVGLGKETRILVSQIDKDPLEIV